jgi:hypothetical protein
MDCQPLMVLQSQGRKADRGVGELAAVGRLIQLLQELSQCL